MRTEFRRTRKPEEFRSLEIFDRKAFREYPADWFGRKAWAVFDSWWMIVDGRKIGCCAFEAHVDFQEWDGENPFVRGSLYIASTGILPGLRGQGFGDLLKCWQIVYARQRGFNRIVTNTRKSNMPMIKLNQKYGFEVLRTAAGYYQCPREATVVMELKL